MVVVLQSYDELGVRIGKFEVWSQRDKAVWQVLLVDVSYLFVEALAQALYKTWDTSALSLRMLGKMLRGQISVKNLSGPITIADYVGQSAKIGWAIYLGFLELGGLKPEDLDGEFLKKLGLLPYQPTVLPVIGKLAEGGVAQRAGLLEGDRILRADGKELAEWEDLVKVVRSHFGQVVLFDI